ncbi:glycoside hydrolase family 13 protein [Myxococcota bacterium]|nr:glycoside hydrolase family 13 protein [Myxococcota bacterium]
MLSLTPLALHALLGVAQAAFPCDGAAADGDIFWTGVLHDSFDKSYREPFGAAPAGGGVVELRLRACRRDLSVVRVRVWDAKARKESWVDLRIAAGSIDPDLGAVEYWIGELPLPSSPTILYYFFELQDGADTDYYVDDEPLFYGGGPGEMSDTYDDTRSFQVSVYDPAFDVPDWLGEAVVYQIFPDRFRDGDPTNNPADGAGWAYGGVPNTTLAWGETPTGDCAGADQLRAQCFAGGDLQGVIDELDGLAALGVTALYLNPIFSAHTNHRYDTVDWFQIDEELGDLSTFTTLLTEAEARGVRVILDGVFNHGSADAPSFDLYSRWDASGALTSAAGPGANDGSGACESPSAATRDWYFFPATDKAAVDASGAKVRCDGVTYEAWGTYFHIPKLNPEAAGVQDLFYNKGTASVAPYWVSLGAAGWRLDVGSEIDPGLTDPDNNSFWEDTRAAVRAVSPDAVLIGEEWDDDSQLLLGGEYDSLMNYRFRAAALDWAFDACTGDGCTGGSSFADDDSQAWRESGEIDAISESQLWLRLTSIREDYPREAHDAMLNLLGSHDTARALWLLQKISGDDAAVATQKLRLLSLLQYTWPGAPMTFYGDEVGVDAASVWDGAVWRDDPTTRATYPWADLGFSPDTSLRDHFAVLGAARGRSEALRRGEVSLVLTDDAARVFAFSRHTADETALIVLNRAAADQTLTLDVADLFSDGELVVDALTGTAYTVVGRDLTVTVSALSGLVLLPPEGEDTEHDTESPDDTDPAGDSGRPDDSASDSAPDDDTAIDDTGDGKVTYPLGCSCGARGGDGAVGWLGLTLALFLARRRGKLSAACD